MSVFEIGSLGRRKRENIFCLQIYIFLYLCDSVDFEEFKFLCKQKIVQKYQNINSRKKEERENPCFIYNIRVFGILRFFIASIKLVPTRFKSSRSRGACLSIHLTISLIKPFFWYTSKRTRSRNIRRGNSRRIKNKSSTGKTGMKLTYRTMESGEGRLDFKFFSSFTFFF